MQREGEGLLGKGRGARGTEAKWQRSRVEWSRQISRVATGRHAEAERLSSTVREPMSSGAENK